MNRLTTQDRVRILTVLSEGMGVNAACRVTGASKNTVLKLLADVGTACALYQDATMRNLKLTDIQVDEIWSFIGAKAKNVPADADPALCLGDCYTFTAIDRNTKLMPCWLVGFRTADCADEFMGDLKARLANRVQLTTDGMNGYPAAVAKHFGNNVDYAVLNKSYAAGPAVKEAKRRYSPAAYSGSTKIAKIGIPFPELVSTSHVERANLSMRMNYGRDGVAETAFSAAEGATAKVLKDIAAARLPPTAQRENHIVLMFHVVSQHARTLSMASEQAEFHDAVSKSIPRSGPSSATETPVAAALRHIVPMFPLTLDLRCLVLVNKTKIPLVTSDNPVVLYNQLLEERSYASNTGLQSVGLQMYFPLNPDVALFFYDQDVYGVGPRNPTSVVLDNPYDVEQLNGLQIVNADESLYFDSSRDLHQLAHWHEKYRPFRRKRRANVVSQREMPIKKDESRELIALFREDVKCNFKPTFLKIFKRARNAKADLMTGSFVRDPELCQKHDHFRELVLLGERQPSEFLQFLRDEA